MEQLNMDKYHRFEVTIKDYPLDEIEREIFMMYADVNKIGMNIEKTGRIVCFDKVKNIRTLITHLAKLGLGDDDIGFIREITEYNPHIEYDEEFLI